MKLSKFHRGSYSHQNIYRERVKKKDYKEAFIDRNDDTAHMDTAEINRSNLWNAERRFPVGDNGILTGTKCGNWHG